MNTKEQRVWFVTGCSTVFGKPGCCRPGGDEETNMTFLDEYLFPNERAALVEALRRDAESERNKAVRDPRWTAYHLQNVRLNVRILEAFGYRLERDALPEAEAHKRSTISASS